MSTLADRLRKLREREVDPIGYHAVAYDVWPELCAVVEAALVQQRSETMPAIGLLDDAIIALARCMDEEAL